MFKESSSQFPPLLTVLRKKGGGTGSWVLTLVASGHQENLIDVDIDGGKKQCQLGTCYEVCKFTRGKRTWEVSGKAHPANVK